MIKADKVITINLTDFQHLRREGDPELEKPRIVSR
jgi:hypothetical protein